MSDECNHGYTHPGVCPVCQTNTVIQRERGDFMPEAQMAKLRESLAERDSEIARLRQQLAVPDDGSLMQIQALEAKLARAEKVIAIAKRASDEIQAQKTMWPGEVDTLMDALAEWEKEQGK